MIKRNCVLSLVIFIFLLAGYGISAEEDSQPTGVFLNRSGIWNGEFVNFVNQEEGIIQKGRIRMKMTVDSNGIIKQSVAIMKPDGTLSDYQGYATMKVEGNRLKWVGSVSEDENTENLIENHVFEGYVGWNHIYSVETYDEVFPDNRREKRKNNMHYVFLSERKFIWLADVHVDGKLLVFANTTLELEN